MKTFGNSIGFIAGGVGDQMYHFTQLKTLAKYSNNQRIDIACISPEIINELLRFSPWAGKIIDARKFRKYLPFLSEKKCLQEIIQTYDTGFVLHRSTSLKFAAFSAGIEHIIGFEGNFFDQFLLSKMIGKNDGGKYRQRWGHRQYIGGMDEWIYSKGLSLEDNTPTILPDKTQINYVTNLIRDLPRPWIISNGFVLKSHRCWPPEHMVECLTKIVEITGGSIILNAGIDASNYFTEISNALVDKIPLFNSLKFFNSISSSLALYHLADIYLGVDSFTANIAYNSNLPAVSIFAKKTDELTYKPLIFPISPEYGNRINSIEISKITEACIKMLNC